MSTHTTVASSEQRVVSSLTIGQLRMLVRNAEARIDHLTEWANAAQPGELRPTDAQIDHAHAQLAHHRARLAGQTLLSECTHSSSRHSPAGDGGSTTILSHV